MMRIIRAFINQPPHRVGEEVALPSDEANHLCRVLRIVNGNRIELLDGRGGRFQGECIEVARERVIVRITNLQTNSPPVPLIRMGVALGKSNKWEKMIRPLTELGVSRMTPLLTDRTEGAFSSQKLKDKSDRWTKLAKEACKQSGNPWLPSFDKPVVFDEIISSPEEGEVRMLASLSDLESESRHLSITHPSVTNQLSIFIGPEGGWSKEEERKAKKAGFSFFTMGPHVLRIETAAVCALAVARKGLLCY